MVLKPGTGFCAVRTGAQLQEAARRNGEAPFDMIPCGSLWVQPGRVDVFWTMEPDPADQRIVFQALEPYRCRVTRDEVGGSTYRPMISVECEPEGGSSRMTSEGRLKLGPRSVVVPLEGPGW